MSPRRRVIAWLHRFSLSGRLRTDRAYDSRQVIDLLSQAHTCVWALGRLVALLSRIRLFLDRLSGFVFGGGGPCTALSPEFRGEGLESQLGRGPRHLGQEGDGLVQLVHGVACLWGALCLMEDERLCKWVISGDSATIIYINTMVINKLCIFFTYFENLFTCSP